jgi:D-lyxose ketol-isomerase
MKCTATKDVTVTLTLNEKEAEALAQICVRVGGKACLRRDFYHDVWREIRAALGDVPNSEDAFEKGGNILLCTGYEGPPLGGG